MIGCGYGYWDVAKEVGDKIMVNIFALKSSMLSIAERI